MKEILPDWLLDRIPKYRNIESIPQAFSDSTHQLWRLEGSSVDNNNHFLKICSHTDSPFWLIMEDLFDFELRSEIADFSDTYAIIDNICDLQIPELIKAESLKNNQAYILSSELKGSVVDNDQNLRQSATQLAEHFAQLHSESSNTWGNLHHPKFTSSDWPQRLQSTLIESSEKWGGVYLASDKYLKQALAACELIKSTDFVPMMTDLRWDQFLQNDNRISALVDLDAFVFAPRELDFVILEFLLSADQLSAFRDAYTENHDIPELKNVRMAYRLLLFYMGILGEKDLDSWMNKEMLF